jgi:hypothetical protein
MPVLLGEFGSKDFGDNSEANSDTTVYSDADRQWLRDTAAYVRGLAGSSGIPASWFFWAWNANSGAAQLKCEHCSMIVHNSAAAALAAWQFAVVAC